MKYTTTDLALASAMKANDFALDKVEFSQGK